MTRGLSPPARGVQTLLTWVLRAPPALLPRWRQVIRKERACGVVPTAPTIYEVLEELAITVQVGGRGRRAACCCYWWWWWWWC